MNSLKTLIKNRKGALNVDSTIKYMIGLMLLLILALTWFFPTLNSAQAFNNSTDLWLAGTNYTWFAGVVSVVVLIVFVLIVYEGRK